MSVSMLMQLKLGATAAGKSRRRLARGIARSVSRKTSMVARWGSIMPAPLAMPTTLPSPTVARRTLGYRSVVMIDWAASSRLAWPRLAAAVGTAPTMASMGMRQPITPVELGSTSVGRRPRAPATAAHRRSAVASPSGARTFETLLLTTMAPRVGSARRRRPMMTGAPGNALRVKTAAKSGVGRSGASNVMLMVAAWPVSAAVNGKRVVPARNPRGKTACVASQARCASRVGKVRFVLAIVYL